MNWFIWRPVVRKIATYKEIMEHWNICDLADAHEALDLQDAADNWYQTQARKKAEAEAEYNR